MMKMKRTLSLVLALVMLVGMFTMVASADTPNPEGNPPANNAVRVTFHFFLNDSGSAATQEIRSSAEKSAGNVTVTGKVGDSILALITSNSVTVPTGYEALGNTWYWLYSGNQVGNSDLLAENHVADGITVCLPVKAVEDDSSSEGDNSPATPILPSFYGTYRSAVKVICDEKAHDTLSYSFTVNKNSTYKQSADGKTVTVYVSPADCEDYVAKYNADTCYKHSYNTKTRQTVAFVLKCEEVTSYNPGNILSWILGGKDQAPAPATVYEWRVAQPAELVAECDPFWYGCCGGWWHKHTVTYTDGVKNEVVFKDITYTVKHGDKTPVPADPTRAGYKFAGWTPAVSAKTTSCVTYTATWVVAKTPDLTSDHVAYIKGYGEGLVKPEGEITRAEAITMLYRLMDSKSAKEFYTPYNNFTDVAKDAWYNDAVSTLANAGVLRYTSGKLNPNEAITRAEFFFMLTKFTDATYSGKCSFKDVPANHWAYDELALAQNLGWIKGYGGGVLYPDDTISRAEVAASLNRVLGRTSCTVKDTKNFVDNPVNAWFYKDIVEASITH